MAKFTSRYQALGFYVKGELKRFSNGQYVTDDKDEVAVLNGLTDVEKAEEAVQQKEETKTEAKPATKAPARKASAK